MISKKAQGERLELSSHRLDQQHSRQRRNAVILGACASAILAAGLNQLDNPCHSEDKCPSTESSLGDELAYSESSSIFENKTDETMFLDSAALEEYRSGDSAAVSIARDFKVSLPALTLEPAPDLEPLPTPKSQAEILGLKLDLAVESAISNMELSQEGYEEFLSSIDTSHLEFAQTFREFNPDLIKTDIGQGPSKIFVLHFTVNYANPDHVSYERNHEPVGEFNVARLIEAMAARYGHGGKCCGVNWMIGRGAKTYQTAPLNAKLNHNPPYNEIATGVEIEARTQAHITTEQYESAAYLAIAVLDTQGLLGNNALRDILKGHGEMRDLIIEEWNAGRPAKNHLGPRDDFDYAESELFRYYIQELLDANPDIIGRQPLADFTL